MCACKAIGEIIRSGMNAFNNGNPGEALARLGEALGEAKLRGSAIHQAKIRVNMALIHSTCGERREAVGHYEQALKQIEQRLGTTNPLYARVRSSFDSLRAAS